MTSDERSGSEEESPIRFSKKSLGLPMHLPSPVRELPLKPLSVGS